MNRRLWSLLCLSGCLCITNLLQADIITEWGSLREFLLGEEPGCAYDNFVTHIVEGIVSPGYNVYNPHDPQTTGFGHFELVPEGGPGDQQLDDWEQLFLYMMRQEYQLAEDHRQAELGTYPYCIVHLIDTVAVREWYLVREVLNPFFNDENNPLTPDDDEHGSFDLGWGLYVFAVGAAHPRVLLELVHPNDDYISPYTGYDMLVELDAGAFFINGAGREVAWTQEGDYSNGKSLSDPSRNERHVFHRAHIAFVDYWIYEEPSPNLPLPIQVHSYDTAGHPDLYSVIVTPGRHDTHYNPPLFDWSGQLGGMIDRTDCMVHPPGFIGNTDQVHITQYYGANSDPPLEVCATTIGNPHDLLGFGGNKQLGYLDDLRDYCTDPEWVLHIEMDELPDCIEDSSEYEFYSQPGYPLTWQNFAGAAAYYHPVGVNLREALDAMTAYNDTDPPVAPDTLYLVQSHSDRVDLGWSRAADPWFYSYHLYYSPTPGVDETHPFYSRENFGLFCAPTTQAVTVTGLEYDVNWYYRLAAIDSSGQLSALSPELEILTYDTDPPVLDVDRPFNFRYTWWNGNSGIVRVEITDDIHVIDGASIQYRRDYHQDGGYNDVMDSWMIAPTLPDSNPLTAVISFQFETPPETARFEMRARDTLAQIWGYTGLQDAPGFEDDFWIVQDTEAPDSPAQLTVDSLSVEGWIDLSWQPIQGDITFDTYRLYYDQSGPPDITSSYFDRFDVEEFGNILSSEARVSCLNEPGDWWLALGSADWAQNLSGLTNAVYILHAGNSGVVVSNLVINYSSGDINLVWETIQAPDFTGTITGYDLHRSTEHQFLPTPETYLTTVSHPFFSEPLPPGPAFYRVIVVFE